MDKKSKALNEGRKRDSANKRRKKEHFSRRNTDKYSRTFPQWHIYSWRKYGQYTNPSPPSHPTLYLSLPIQTFTLPFDTKLVFHSFLLRYSNLLRHRFPPPALKSASAFHFGKLSIYYWRHGPLYLFRIAAFSRPQKLQCQADPIKVFQFRLPE